jgi:hypothetical protein
MYAREPLMKKTSLPDHDSEGGFDPSRMWKADVCIHDITRKSE